MICKCGGNYGSLIFDSFDILGKIGGKVIYIEGLGYLRLVE